MGYTVFISYSHQDTELVTPVTKLLRTTKGAVFQDSDSLVAGKKWRQQLSSAINEVNLVVVFWCVHSSQSQEVEKEYAEAILAGKGGRGRISEGAELPVKS